MKILLMALAGLAVVSGSACADPIAVRSLAVGACFGALEEMTGRSSYQLQVSRPGLELLVACEEAPLPMLQKLKGLGNAFTSGEEIRRRQAPQTKP